MSEQPAVNWLRPIGLRCAQCRRYLPTDEAVDELLEDLGIDPLCEECHRMRGRGK